MPTEVIVTANAPSSSSNASRVEVPTIRSAETVESYTHSNMSRAFHIIQLNVRGQPEIDDSLMNDEETPSAAVLAIQKHHARIIHGRPLTMSMAHHRRTYIGPSSVNVNFIKRCVG